MNNEPDFRVFKGSWQVGVVPEVLSPVDFKSLEKAKESI